MKTSWLTAVALITGCVVETDLDESAVDQAAIVNDPSMCAPSYPATRVRGRAIQRYNTCTEAWETQTVCGVAQQAVQGRGTSATCVDVPTCTYGGITLRAGDSACWPGDNHYMMTCSPSGGAMEWHTKSGWHCGMPAGNGSDIISRIGAARWLGDGTNFSAPPLNYTDASYNTANASLANVLGQSLDFNELCYATSQCPSTAVCASYQIDGVKQPATCKSDENVMNWITNTAIPYVTYYDHAGNNVVGGVW
jgi:hypothetical protein